MTANELIETYINDVAVRLPRRLRNDVAFELRALLGEELQGRAESAGQAAGAEMALVMLRAFGHPAEVASRYQPTLSVIDPADGRRFLRLSLIGLVFIWVAGFIAVFGQPEAGATNLLSLISQWWMGVVIQSFWWPGVLVVGFGLSAHLRQRKPERDQWKPRSPDQVPGGRVALVLAIVGTLLGVAILINPRWILDLFFGGRAAPAAYVALSWSESFLGRQAPWLFALVALNVPVFIAVMVNGRWTAKLRLLQDGLAVLTGAVMAWAVLDGPMMMAADSDRMAKFCMTLIIAWMVFDLLLKLYRRVVPKPGHDATALR